MRILIVEDEKVSRQKMELIMNNYGECDSYARGGLALDAFHKAWEMRAPYDIITLDIFLEDMNGMDVLVSIREAEEKMQIPHAKKSKVIMVTSHSDKDYIVTCKTANCNGYIVKPFSKDSITKCLNNIYLNYVNNILTFAP